MRTFLCVLSAVAAMAASAASAGDALALGQGTTLSGKVLHLTGRHGQQPILRVHAGKWDKLSLCFSPTPSDECVPIRDSAPIPVSARAVVAACHSPTEPCTVPVYFHAPTPASLAAVRVRYVGEQAAHEDSLDAFKGLVGAGLDHCTDTQAAVLTQGTLKSSTVDAGKYACYTITFTPATQPDLRVEVTPQGGDADLYVNLGGTEWPTWQTYHAKASEIGFDTIDLVAGSQLVTDHCPNPADACTVRIAVTDSDFFAPTVQFNVLVLGNSGGGDVVLQLDEPVLASLYVTPGTAAQVYNYYTFPGIAHGKSVNIIVTAMVGDPDFYYGWDALVQPTMHNNDGSDLTLGDGQLTVTCLSGTGAQACDLHIGVTGFAHSNTTYTIRIESPDAVITLQDGIAQDGAVLAGKMNYYTFTLPTGNTRGADVWVIPTGGDPDLYLNLNGQNPSPGSHERVSFHTSGIEHIGLTPEDVNKEGHCPNGAACVARIGVQGFSDASYIITASGNRGSDNITTLAAGVPLPGIVSSGEYMYYAFTPVDTTVPVSISLSPRSGDPDMFVKASAPGVPVHPSATDHTWAVNGFGNETLVIPPTDTRLWAGATLYIAVSAFAAGQPHATAEYYIEALDETATAVTMLPPGITLRAEGNAGAYLFYQFTVEGDEGYDSISFELTPVVGASRMYVTRNPGGTQIQFPTVTCSQHGTGGECTQWTPDNYDFRGNQMEDGNFLLTLSDATWLSSKQHFLIAVLAQNANGSPSTFEIEASVSLGGGSTTSGTEPTAPIEELEWGQSSDGEVFTGTDKNHVHYMYYSVQLTAPTDVRILAQATEGAASLYGSSTGAYPHLGESEFRGAVNFGVEGLSEMFVAYSRLSAACTAGITAGTGCTLYFSVSARVAQASASTVFSVRALASGSAPVNPLPLADGDTLVGYVDRQEYIYYLATINIEQGDGIYISVASLAGDADLYVNLGPQGTPFYPDSAHDPPQFAALGIDGPDTIAVYPESPHYCTACNVYISVRGYHDDGSLFTISLTTDGTIASLPVNGPPAGGGALGGNMTYYRVDMSQFGNAKVDLTLNVDALYGEPSLVVVVDDGKAPPTLPTLTVNTWRLPYYSQSKSLVIPASDEKACKGRSCAYIVGVEAAVHEDTGFLLSAVATSVPPAVTPLLDGVTQSGVVPADQCVYFQFEPVAPGVVPNPPLSTDFAWHSDTGGFVTVYITNSFVSGVSPADKLPNSHSTTDPCLLTYDQGETDARFSATTSPTECYANQVNVTYTLGVCGISFAHGGSVEFSLVADVGHAPVVLAPGAPSVVATVDKTYVPNKNFEFHVTDPSLGLDLSSEVLQGDVTVYVSAPTTPGGVAPSASPTKFQWSSNTADMEDHAAVIAIPADGPCAHGATTCTFTSIPTGIWSVQVVPSTTVTAKFSLLLEEAGGRITPASGEPVVLDLAIADICRDHNEDGSCASAPLGQSYVAWLAFSVPMPAALPGGDLVAATTSESPAEILAASFTIEVTCGDAGTTEYCGQEHMGYIAAATACGPETCAASDQYPVPTEYGGNPVVEDSTTTQQLTLAVPASACAAGTATTDGGMCTVFVGLYAAPNNGKPLKSATPPTMVVTAVDPAAPTEIPAACFQAKNTCLLPPATEVPGNSYVRFSGFVPQGSPINIAVRVQACRGTGKVYACNDHTSDRCHPFNMPSSTQNDAAWTYGVPSNGDAPAWTSHTLGAQDGDFYLAVKPSPVTGSSANPAFQMLVQAGNAGILWLPSSNQGESAATADWVDTSSSLSVTWGETYAVFPGQAVQKVTGVRYTVYVAPSAQVSTGAVVDTACGVQLEWTENLATIGVSALTLGDTRAALIEGLTPGVTYTVMVVASCTGGPAGQDHCSIAGVQGQSIAYEHTTITIPGGGGSGNHNGKKAPDNGGAIAGGVIGGLIALGLVLFAVWWVYKHPESAVCCQSKKSGGGYGQLDDGFYSSADVGASSGYDRL